MKKRIGMFLIVLCTCLGLLAPDATVWAAAGKTSVSVSASSVNIGDTVTVTGKATGPSGEKVLATMTLSWDANVLEYVSCSVDSNGGGGSRVMNGDSFTITLKAISAGTGAVSLSATDGVLFDTVESLDSMAGSSASVTVNNTAGTGTGTTGGGSAPSETLSADNSLKSLAISPGTLSPSFVYNKTSYTATVGSDVTSVAVSATPANDKAVVESVMGNDKLTEGTNTIKIVVKAENGVTATYTIKVTKQAAAGGTASASEAEEKPEPTDETGETEASGQITVNGVSYQIAENFSAEDIPIDFSESEISYHGSLYKGVSYTKGSLNLLWLTTENAAGKFFVYDETRDNLYPFVQLTNGEKYVIALASPVDFTMPEYYLQTNLVIDDENSMIAYQKIAEDESEIVSAFYVFYGVNHEGAESWYQYDASEGTYQRLSASIAEEEDSASSEDLTYLQEEYASLSEKYEKERVFARNTIAVLVFIIAVLVIVIINLLIYRFRKTDQDEFFEEEEDELEETEEELTEDDRKSVGFFLKRPGKRANDEVKTESGDIESDENELDEIEPDEAIREEKTTDNLKIIDFNDL